MNRKLSIGIGLIALLLALLLACNDLLKPQGETASAIVVPAGFPALPYPEDNVPTSERIALGRKLFYDPILSRDGSISCASCHRQEMAFTDGTKISPGVEKRLGFRNTPTLANIAYHPYFFKEGGNPTLEMQVMGPLTNHDEMDMDADEVRRRLNNHPVYEPLAQKAYGRPMDFYVLTRAIASFERSLLSGNSRYDQYQRNKNVLWTRQEELGRQLFFSDRTNCGSCHGGFDFTQYQLENNGLYREYEDKGLHRISGREADIGRFKVPSLRNIELTAPYMHDGSLASLEAVINHYDRGGAGRSNQSDLIKPLNLSKEEKEALIAFLKTLTDQYFLQNKALGPPEK